MITFRKQGRPLLLVLAVVILLALLLGWRSLERYQSFFGMYHDDALYLVTAKALAEGQGYKIISLPGDPPETKYPIGYPLYLSSLWKMLPNFPQNLPFLSALQMVLALSVDILSVIYLRRTRRITPLVASVILTACLLNYHFLDFAPMIMSDMPYALAAVLALWTTERAARARKLDPAVKLTRPLLLVGILLMAAVLIRSQGLVIVLACLFYLVRRTGWRSAAVAALLPAVTLALQFGWQVTQRQSMPQFLSFYTSYFSHTYGTLPDTATMWESFFSAFYWGWRLAVNTHCPFLQEIPYATLPPLLFELLFRIIYPVLALPLFIGVTNGARRGNLIGIYCFLYGFSFLFWPLRLEWRHMFVGTPFTYCFYGHGLRLISRRLKPKNALARKVYTRMSAVSAVVCCLYLALGTAAEAFLSNEQFSRLIAMPTLQFDQTVLDKDYKEAYDWIRSQTPPSAVFISNNDPRLYLYTDRKAVLPSQLELWRFAQLRLVDAESLVQAIKFAHAEFVISEPTFRSTGLATEQTERALFELSRSNPGLLKPSFQSSAGLIRIFSVDAGKLRTE